MRALTPWFLAAALPLAPLLFACGSRPKAQSCSIHADCAVADECSAGICVPLSCGAGLAPCTGACADLATAGGHCGSCGHDCGGGVCSVGQCQPMVVRDGLSYPVFDIDETSLYFHSGDKILACPLDGCGALAPRQLGAVTAPIDGGNAGGVMLVSRTVVVFMAEALTGTSGPYLHACPLQAGCPATPAILGSASHQGFSGGYALAGGDFYWGHYRNLDHAGCDPGGNCAPGEVLRVSTALAPASLAADASGVYFPDPDAPANLVRCPRTGTCTPEPVGTGLPAWTAMAARDSKIFMLASGRDGYNDGAVRSCPAAASACTPALLAGNQPFPLSFAVDENAISWLLRDAPAGGSPMSIVTCPVTGCAGGPRAVAANQVGAYGLRSDARFVYWATPTQILRVAK